MNRELGSSILMVTHNATVASYAQRVVFLSDGKLYTEIFRGERHQQEFYRDILTVMETYGGNEDVD